MGHCVAWGGRRSLARKLQVHFATTVKESNSSTTDEQVKNVMWLSRSTTLCANFRPRMLPMTLSWHVADSFRIVLAPLRVSLNRLESKYFAVDVEFDSCPQVLDVLQGPRSLSYGMRLVSVRSVVLFGSVASWVVELYHKAVRGTRRRIGVPVVHFRRHNLRPLDRRYSAC